MITNKIIPTLMARLAIAGTPISGSAPIRSEHESPCPFGRYFTSSYDNAKSGISIIEMLMAMLSSAILALTVGIMLVTSYKAWRDNNRYIALQEEASLAATVAEKWVHDAAYWQVNASNNMIAITISNVTKRIYRNANNLIYDPNISTSGNELLIATNHVSSFLTRQASAGVYMDLWLKDGAINSELHTFINFRN